MTRFLEVQDLEARFKVRNGFVYAVNGVSFGLDRGEMLGVVGESGCGKSVTMMSLIRLLPPAAQIVRGKVVLDGIDLTAAGTKEINAVRGSRVGMIFQDPMTSLHPFLRIGLQMSEGIVYHRKLSMAEALKRSAIYLDLVGIPNSSQVLKAYPHQLSGGMRQRVMIGMALLSEPSLVIADEPTTALDVTIQAQVVELVKDLRRKLNTAFIWITHDLSLLAGLVDRILVMYAGYVVEEAPADDLYRNPRHPYTIGLLQAIPRLAAVGDKRLASIPRAPPNLFVKPTNCPFAPRCGHASDRCRRENPVLTAAAGAAASHRVACWADPPSGGKP